MILGDKMTDAQNTVPLNNVPKDLTKTKPTKLPGLEEKKPESIHAKPNRKDLKWQRERNDEKVTGIFRFHEVPGGTLEFVFKEFKEVPTERYSLVDGVIYTIPRGVALHLNKNVKYPVNSYQMDADGKPSQNVGKWVKRCSFQSLEFMDIEDGTILTNEII